MILPSHPFPPSPPLSPSPPTPPHHQRQPLIPLHPAPDPDNSERMILTCSALPQKSTEDQSIGASVISAVQCLSCTGHFVYTFVAPHFIQWCHLYLLSCCCGCSIHLYTCTVSHTHIQGTPFSARQENTSLTPLFAVLLLCSEQRRRGAQTAG